MKIKEIKLKNFKRFTDLTIKSLPETTKLVVLVGPNGCGKTSLFEAFNHWYSFKGFSTIDAWDYLYKHTEVPNPDYNAWLQNNVKIDFYNHERLNMEEIRESFYFRTAYRNEPDFIAKQIIASTPPTQSLRLPSLISNDSCVSDNYKRIIYSGAQELFNENDSIYSEFTLRQYRENIIGEIQKSLDYVLSGIQLCSLGNASKTGTFYFNKGTSKFFPYKNLSAGEKAAFDLILDLYVKKIYYKEGIYCIDEPESHMHTQLQGRLLEELYDIIPDTSQLWIATHSLGMLKKAKELEKDKPGTVIFLDFEDKDFDSKVILEPAIIDKTIWNRFVQLALDDFSTLVAPKTIVFCEGNSQGRKIKNFDSQIYDIIFGSTYVDVSFISVGSCNDLIKVENPTIDILSKILSKSTNIKLVDRDYRNEDEINDLRDKGIKVLKKRHLECYLFDDAIIEKFCILINKRDKYDECLEAKKKAIENCIGRGRPSDDVKAASNEIYDSIRRILELNRHGTDANAFMKSYLAPLITPETEVYQELQRIIFF